MTFEQLFVGSDRAHGEWAAEDKAMMPGGAKTVKAPAVAEHYQQHLEGVRGLGLVPTRSDGTCRFAAIDLDIDTIDHVQLEKRVRELELPLYVCRSKSGGAHLYVFLDEPGMSARELRRYLKKWAGALGYPKTEIFPKQDTVSDRNLGNWINLPYFNSDEGVRYCVWDGRVLSLAEFLETVRYWDGSEPKVKVDQKQLVDLEKMPPCLVQITNEGMPEGNRNSAMFNFAVFFRKAYPHGWEDKVMEWNRSHMKPALPYREIQGILASVNRNTKYQYKCSEEPICSRCDRKKCVSLEFGVDYQPWKDQDNFDELVVSNLRKQNSDPPLYVLEVNGRDLTLTHEDFFSWARFSHRARAKLDLVLKPAKQNDWDLKQKELLQHVTYIDTPKTADEEGVLLQHINEWLARYDGVEDLGLIQKGWPVEHKDHVVFDPIHLRNHLNRIREKFTMRELFHLVHEHYEGRELIVFLTGRQKQVWAVDKSKIVLPHFEPINLKGISDEL